MFFLMPIGIKSNNELYNSGNCYCVDLGQITFDARDVTYDTSRWCKLYLD